jgi:hypothetical protein
MTFELPRPLRGDQRPHVQSTQGVPKAVRGWLPAASDSTAARAVSSDVCPYTSPAIAMELCPRPIGSPVEQTDLYRPVGLPAYPCRTTHARGLGSLGPVMASQRLATIAPHGNCDGPGNPPGEVLPGAADKATESSCYAGVFAYRIEAADGHPPPPRTSSRSNAKRPR